MKKEDFHKGQTVWIYLMNDAARGKKTIEERIREWEVVSVGRKYITARPKCGREWHNVRFEIDREFRHYHTYGAPSYILYLSKDDIFHDLWQSKTRRYIEDFARWERAMINKLSDEDLRKVAEIFRKYDRDGV